MYQALFGTDIINRKEMVYLDTFTLIARHFANWGAEHFRDTTNMIEPSEDLEKEIDKYFQPIQAWEVQEAPFSSLDKCARHFAQWQKERIIKAFPKKCKQEEIDPAIAKVIEDHWWEML